MSLSHLKHARRRGTVVSAASFSRSSLLVLSGFSLAHPEVVISEAVQAGSTSRTTPRRLRQLRLQVVQGAVEYRAEVHRTRPGIVNALAGRHPEVLAAGGAAHRAHRMAARGGWNEG